MLFLLEKLWKYTHFPYSFNIQAKLVNLNGYYRKIVYSCLNILVNDVSWHILL